MERDICIMRHEFKKADPYGLTYRCTNCGQIYHYTVIKDLGTECPGIEEDDDDYWD